MFRQVNILPVVPVLVCALGLIVVPAGSALTPSAAPASLSRPAPRTIALGKAATAIVPGEPLQFLDTSQGTPTSWSWDFSYDGSQPVADSTVQNPLWTFDQTGVFTVRLEVCNDGGCSAATQDLTVVVPCTLTGDLVVPDVAPATVSTTVTYEACHTITTSGVLSIVDPGSVVFRAGSKITLSDGFSAGGGGASFTAVIDPTLNTP